MSSFALVGPPGSGKTTMISSACKAGYTVDLIDTDKKVEDMANLRNYIADGQINVIPINSLLVEESLLDRAKKPGSFPKKQPEGYLEFVTIINDMYDSEPAADILAVDSYSRVCAHLKRYMLFLCKKHHFEYGDWDSWYTMHDELTESILGVPHYKHVIITYHEKIIRDEITGQIMVPVSVDGKYAHEVGRYFSEMYALEVVVTKDGKATFRCMTKPDKRRNARSSFSNETYIPSDLSKLLPKKGG